MAEKKTGKNLTIELDRDVSIPLKIEIGVEQNSWYFLQITIIEYPVKTRFTNFEGFIKSLGQIEKYLRRFLKDEKASKRLDEYLDLKEIVSELVENLGMRNFPNEPKSEKDKRFPF